MIDLYTWITPNGQKISIALEEMGLEYKVRPIDISKGEQFEPGYLQINPNNMVPAIYDHGLGHSVFESGAILIHLAEKTGQFLPKELPARAKVLEWVAWQIAGFGPILEELDYFINRAEEQVPYATGRFLGEATRLFKVLDGQLSDKEFVAGEYSIADMAIYPWSALALAPLQAATGASFANVAAWHERIAARPNVQAGLNVLES